jgi:3-dehydroquinate dehydratase-2
VRALFLFGPNLGALGTRDPERYGSETLEEVMAGVAKDAAERGRDVTWRQSDHEGDLVGWLGAAGKEGFDAVVINPGGLTHYSHALRDAVEGCGLPVVEVHQTNIYSREEFRRHSVVSPACRAVIAGLGTRGYHLALEALAWISPDGERASPRG